MNRYSKVALLLLFLVVGITAEAQHKIYYTLGVKYKGLRQDQITITSGYRYIRADFVYNQYKHKAYFTRDSNLTAIAVVQKNALCPAYILNEMNCLYHTYKVKEWTQKEYYYNDKVDYKQTEVLISSIDENKLERIEKWEYMNGVRSEYSLDMEFRDGDYVAMEYLLADAGETEEGKQWYGGSFEAFKDSIKKYVHVKDASCLKQFEGKNLLVYIYVNEQGKIVSSGFAVPVPYIVKEEFDRFCKKIVFPSSSTTTSQNLYHYGFNIKLSVTKGVEVWP